MNLGNFYKNMALPVCVVSSGYEDAFNCMTVAWSMPMSINPPLYGFAIKNSRYTYKEIKRLKDFSVSFAKYEHSKLITQIGRISGREVNKKNYFNLNVKKSDIIQSEYIDFDYFSFECKVKDFFQTGDHDLIIGEVVSIHESNKLKDIKPCIYINDNKCTSLNYSDNLEFNIADVVAEIRENIRSDKNA